MHDDGLWSCGKVMFLHLSVILFTGRCKLPWTDTPLERHPQADTPWQTLPPGQTPPRKTPPGQIPQGRHPKTTTTADDTHPTEMHSCFHCLYITFNSFINFLWESADPVSVLLKNWSYLVVESFRKMLHTTAKCYNFHKQRDTWCIFSWFVFKMFLKVSVDTWWMRFLSVYW